MDSRPTVAALTGLLVAALLPALLFACRPAEERPAPPTATATFATEEIPDSQLDPGALSTRAPDDCPGVESMVLQIVNAEEPLAMADELGQRVQGEQLQVILVLEGEDLAFLIPYGVQIGTQVGNQIQAFVPIDRICELAGEKRVLAVRPAALPQ